MTTGPHFPRARSRRPITVGCDTSQNRIGSFPRSKARTRLPELHKAFDAGLAPGEFVYLKVPFDVAGGGHEYMWVEVTQWRSDGRIEGTLGNEPEQLPDLHAGAIVSFAQGDVFDYIVHHADGSDEGNETGQLILKMEEGK